MSTPDLHPIPFATLVDRLDRELAAGGALYTVRRRDWWTPDPDRDVATSHFGQRIGTPAGPASGPHTQLAQNLVAAWLAGSRFMELKTVQVLDELELPRPCIFVPHVGWNVEWSQELLVPQSALEYIKGWMLVHMLASAQGPGLWPATDTVFDVSLGYDLAGVRSEKVGAFLRWMSNAGDVIAALRDFLPPRLQRWADVSVPSKISNTVTLSTFHGCPASEIEAIASQMLEWGWNTVIKLNPTLHGFSGVRGILDDMGYADIGLATHHFDNDLTWEQLEEMVPRLQAQADAAGLGFGVKFSNTLVAQAPETPFFADNGGQGEMYLSGPPLHVLAFTLAARFRAAFPDVPITFSAGIDADNFKTCVRGGLGPVTSCSDLLKGGGYGRMAKYLRNLERDMAAHGASTIAAYTLGADDLIATANALVADTRYHHSANAKAPRKVGTELDLLDCLTCDKCVPVCPNLANFTVPVTQGTYSPGQVTWTDADFTVAPGAQLIANKRHQIGNVADVCNLCGQCDTWCPEDGGPYLVKPSVFLNPASFGDHPDRDAFLVDADRQGIAWRRQGALYYYRRGERNTAVLSIEGGVLTLRDGTVLASAGAGSVDLTIATTMRLFLEGFQTAELWLPAADAPTTPTSA